MAGRRQASTRSAAEPVAIRIERIGAEGDGIGTLPSGRLAFVPFVLPSELVRVRPVARRGDGWAAVPDALIESHPDRVTPPCPHFGACGGCALQHWDLPAYHAWKAGLLHDALRRAGYSDVPISAVVSTPAHARRRMDLGIRRVGRTVIAGLHRRRDMQVVEIETCDVLRPELVTLIGPLRGVLSGIAGLRAKGSVVVNLLDSGSDLLLRTDGSLNLHDREQLIAFARAHDLPRVSWAGNGGEPEPVCILRPATTVLSGVTVSPPPGAFLQASGEGEAAIIAAVLAGLPERLPSRARIAELFAGCGTLSFALARHARVAAWEGDRAATAALRSASHSAGLAGRIEVRERDLARQPVAAAELAGFAAVVLDPPHAGAAAQIGAIAASGCPRVIYVSCNPAALARDARTLHAAGYHVLGATPIDQFLWSARVESVVVFGRERT
ncbi:MAG TPA: class I SAM-dependent RNA methyltransferase [Acetobacteraceae bacterium]|nr:class I SAM-dependent RNA methyltransferase [Acetobacteraceae bacterium]